MNRSLLPTFVAILAAMNFLLRRLLCLSSWAAFLWPMSASAEPTPPPSVALSPEAVADFEWFGTLSFPDVHGCPCARVATGWWSQSGSHPPQNKTIDAFLLGHDDSTGHFRVLTSDLFTRDFEATKPDKPEHERVGYEEKPLAAEADAYLSALDHPPEEDDGGLMRRFGEQLSERSEVFAWAWACWRHGLDERAARFYQHAAAMSSRMDRDEQGRPQPPATLREGLERDLGYAMIWRATLEFEDPKILRSQLLESFERVAHNYPHSQYAASARETADRLRAMVAEDAAHAAPAAPLADLSPDDRAAELIFRLRDQNGHQWSQPGSCDIFDDFGGAVEADPHKEKSPAVQLAELGYAAVPRLIAALDDRTFSRSVGYHRNFYFSHHVLTVGDCAEQTLQRIAGRSFYTAKTTSSYMSRDDETAGVKKEVEAWWREFQQKGEKQTLIDAVGAGGQNGYQQAALLCKRYPDAALAPLIQGAQNSTEGWAREQLVTLAGKQPGEGALPFLEEELHAGPLLGGRLAAAQALWQHGRGAEATAAMIDEWAHQNAKSSDEQARAELIGFLAGCERVDAIEALGHDLRQRPVGTRLDLVSAFDTSRSNFSTFASGSGGTGDVTANHDLRRQGTDEEAKVNAAVEALLVAELDDREQRLGMSGTRNGKNFSDPRVCDLAGEILATRFKDRYAFDLGASAKIRERQRLTCLNVWREAHGEPSLPLPPERHIESVADATIQPLLHTLAASDHEEERTSAVAAISKLGLSALGSLRAFETALPTGDPTRPRLETMEHSLACTVTEVTLENVPGGAAKWQQGAQARLDELKGEPLTSARFVALVITAVDEIPAGASGFELSAARDEDFSGVRLTLKLLTGHEDSADTSSNATNEHVTLAGESLHSSSGSSSMDYLREAKSYKEFTRAADRALRAAADQPFSLMFSLNVR